MKKYHNMPEISGKGGHPMRRDTRYGRLVMLGLMIFSSLCFQSLPAVQAGQEPVQVQLQGMQAVNVNSAAAQELEQIRGIGPELAARIVAYRQENGAFKTVEDLRAVRGIGAMKLEKIKQQVTV